MSDSQSKNRLGRFVETVAANETVRAFVPPPLPPEPTIDVLSLLERLSLAERALGRLDGITMLLPRQELFLYMYVRKEAVLSSQIEGTQSTLSDLLRFETEAQAGQPVNDIREVSNYVDAMMYGLERLETLPMSLRLIREMHARLLHSGRGGTKDPGEFRRSQNWIGGTRPGNALFVPPPVTEMAGCLDAFERFMHDDQSRLPALIKAGLLHVQFETIHPFLDGNGRIGRLLVTLYLCVNGVLRKPLLYLSLYLSPIEKNIIGYCKRSVSMETGKLGSTFSWPALPTLPIERLRLRPRSSIFSRKIGSGSRWRVIEQGRPFVFTSLSSRILFTQRTRLFR